MTKPDPDDFEAVRAIVQALQPFQRDDQERILRWAREKVGLATAVPAHGGGTGTGSTTGGAAAAIAAAGERASGPSGTAVDIKTFVTEKNPQSDTHFAATVAYYYRFEAPEAERKQAISSDDLQDATRRVSRSRLKLPIKTLLNAHRDGLLDKAERGTYRINSVGENLVAMALPAPTGTTPLKRKPKSKAKKAKKARKL